MDILGSLGDVALDVHGETWGLRDCKAEVEGDDTGNAAEANEDTPAVVNWRGGRVRCREDCILEGRQDDDGNDSRCWSKL